MGTDNDDLPQTPPNPVPPGYFSASFERLTRENEMADWAGAFTLFGEHFLFSDVGVRCMSGLLISAFAGP